MFGAFLGTAAANKGIAVAVGLGVLFAGTVAVEESGAGDSVLDAVGVQTSSQDRGTAVCHSPRENPGNARTVSVTDEGLAEHLAHGDVPGACAGSGVPLEAGPATNVPVGKVAICHAPAGNPGDARTIVVGEESAANHVEHGDAEGPCAESLGTGRRGRPDHAGQERGRAEPSTAGATEKTSICHKGRWTAVPFASLADHLEHGDAAGQCGQPAQLN